MCIFLIGWHLLIVNEGKNAFNLKKMGICPPLNPPPETPNLSVQTFKNVRPNLSVQVSVQTHFSSFLLPPHFSTFKHHFIVILSPFYQSSPNLPIPLNKAV